MSRSYSHIRYGGQRLASNITGRRLMAGRCGQDLVHPGGSVVPGGWRGMDVDIKRGGDARMAKQRLDLFDVGAIIQQQRGSGMARVIPLWGSMLALSTWP